MELRQQRLLFKLSPNADKAVTKYALLFKFSPKGIKNWKYAWMENMNTCPGMPGLWQYLAKWPRIVRGMPAWLKPATCNISNGGSQWCTGLLATVLLTYTKFQHLRYVFNASWYFNTFITSMSALSTILKYTSESTSALAESSDTVTLLKFAQASHASVSIPRQFQGNACSDYMFKNLRIRNSISEYSQTC